MSRATTSSSGPLVYPEAWRERVMQQFAEGAPIVDFPDPLRGSAPLPPWADASIEPAKLYPRRLRPTRSQRRAGSEALYSYYEYSDRLVGEILAETGSRDGITPGSSTEGTKILDIVPSVLAWWGLPAARDMSGRVAPFLQPESVARVDTYDTTPIERIGSGPSGSDEQILERPARTRISGRGGRERRGLMHMPREGFFRGINFRVRGAGAGTQLGSPYRRRRSAIDGWLIRR